MFKPTITSEEINELPLLQFDGKIHIIDKDDQIPQAVSVLSQQKRIGFDTETKPNFQKGKKRNKVALLQLATENETFLFRLHYLKNLRPIFDILSNPNIKKIGVAVNGDFKELSRLQNFEPANFLELQKYVKNFGIENISLKKMTGIILNKRISKRQQRSNWENETLTEAQQIYAATDAWVCLLLYEKLKDADK